MYKIDPKIILVLKHVMSKCSTVRKVFNGKTNHTTIYFAIFQGSLTPADLLSFKIYKLSY